MNLSLKYTTGIGRFCFENNISDWKYLDYVGHKMYYDVFGSLYKIKTGYIFSQHVWSIINKDKPIPKPVVGEIFKYKIVDETFFDSFKFLTHREFHDRDNLQFINTNE